MSFSDLGLAPELSRAVADSGYVSPTPIQAQAIPAVLAGRDVLAGAQTGTGKTAAFVLPILQKLGSAKSRAPRALVLTPTRELAAQVAESARTYGRHVDLRTEVVFGGVSINPQIGALRRGCDLLVATPGRLLDLAEQNALDLREVSVFVLDEADRMLDMGFIPAIRRVIRLLPARRQNLMFSATYSDEIRELANRILREPAEIEVAPRNATADRVEQAAYRVSKEDKRHLLAHLIQEGDWHQVLVFTRTKHGANRLAQQLEGAGITTAAIHGNKSQGARVKALSDFKANKVTALVATEVAARGLDIKELPHVVNYELPNVPQDYVHRIGRTARAGGAGCAVSLVAPDEVPLLRDIERLLRKSVQVLPTPSFTVPQMQPRTSAAPAAQDGGQASRRDGSRPRYESRPGGGSPPRRGQQDSRRGGGGTPSRHGQQDSRRSGTQPQRHHDSRSGGPAPRHQTGSRPTGTQQGHHRSDASRPQRRRDRQPEGQGGGGDGFSRVG
jgi:ATP-dependent RNA helicase RhlE